MKTKREVLKTIAKQGTCVDISCHDCPYYYRKRHCPDSFQANAVLQMFPEKKKHILDIGTKVRFDDGSIARIESTTAGPELLFYTINGCTSRSLSYLVGRTWEVVE